MLFNHQQSPNIELNIIDSLDSNEHIRASNTNANQNSNRSLIHAVATRDIYTGEELFISYGNEAWFMQRNITMLDPPLSSSLLSDPIPGFEELICVTDVYISNSMISNAGIGMFANKSFHKGDIITTSPVIFVPKSRVSHTLLYSYLLVSDQEV